MKSTSRRRTVAGEVVQTRFRDLGQLVALRRARPDEKGRPGRSLTQRQAAAHVGISHGHYGDLEAGRRHPSLVVAERVAAFYGVPLDVLCAVAPAARLPGAPAPSDPGESPDPGDGGPGVQEGG